MNNSINKIRLFCIEAEQCFLGALLIDGLLWEKISDLVLIDDLFFKNHKIIFSVITDLISFKKTYDVIVVYEELKKSISSHNYLDILNYLNILIKKTPNSMNIIEYASIIHNMSILRKLFYTSKNLINEIYLSQNIDINILLKKLELDILSINKYNNKNKIGLINIDSVIKTALINIENLRKSDVSISGISTGFNELDEILSGLHNGELIIVAGRPSMGKTAFSMNIAQNVSLNLNLPIVIFSMEMSSSQLALRFLSSFSSFDQHNIRTGRLTSNQLIKLKIISESLCALKIFIDESVLLTPADIYIKSKRIIDEYGRLGLIIVDYLQLMNSSDYNSINRVMEISEISRTLKCIARDLNVPLIAISQLNRGLENRNNKRPMMSDLRESGAIEQDADVILFIYRDEVYDPYTQDKGLAEIIISKQRNGPIGTINLSFLSNILKFGTYNSL